MTLRLSLFLFHRQNNPFYSYLNFIVCHVHKVAKYHRGKEVNSHKRLLKRQQIWDCACVCVCTRDHSTVCFAKTHNNTLNRINCSNCFAMYFQLSLTLCALRLSTLTATVADSCDDGECFVVAVIYFNMHFHEKFTTLC